MAAVTTVCAVIHPDILSAQTSGVGCDGVTRALWRGTDSSFSLWKLDANLAYITYKAYGPFDGYVPIAITVGCDNYTRVLWKVTNGAWVVWLVDPDLNYVGGITYGPVWGWAPESLSIDSNNRTRLILRETQGKIDVWMLDPSLKYLTSHVYGPYFGYDPGAGAEKSGAAALKAPVFGTEDAPGRPDTPEIMKHADSVPIPPQ